MVAAYDAALKDAPKALNRVGVHCANNVLAGRVIDGLMVVIDAKASLAPEFIGREQADLIGYGFADEVLQIFLADKTQYAGHYVALALDSPNDGRLGGRRVLAALTAFGDVFILVLSADEGFVHLNDAAKLVHVLLNEGGADAVAHIPSGFVGAEAHRPHDLERRHAFLAGQHHVSDGIPVAERLFGVLENGPDQMGEAVGGFGSAVVALPLERFTRQLGGIRTTA